MSKPVSIQRRSNKKPPTNKPVRPAEPFVPPYRRNYYSYNGKYYSTLADVSVNSGLRYCQNTYYCLPRDWILAPDDDDSLDVITANSWSTDTVVVAASGSDSRNGYYSGSGFNNNNLSNWLLASKNTTDLYYCYAYNCAKCNCEVLILYSPDPTSTSTSSKPLLSLLHIGYISVFSFIGLIFGAMYIYAYYIKPRRTQVQAQPDSQPASHEPTVVSNGKDDHCMEVQPFVDSTNGYVQLQQLPANEQHHISLEPQPELPGHNNPHHLDGQPQPQVHGYGQTQPQIPMISRT
eukprot:gene32311-41872_t